jgi:hypothetical protein
LSVFSRFEGGLDNAFDRAAGTVFRGPLEPAQIAKRAEKQMNREKLVGAGKQYAPTLYTVLVSAGDNRKLFGFYPTMAAEIETYLVGKGTQNGLKFDGRPLVRFIVDGKLKSGKFDVIAESVAAPLIVKLRDEEMEFYGLKEPGDDAGADGPVPGIAGTSSVLPAAAPSPSVPGSSSSQKNPNFSASSDSAALGQARLTDLNAGRSYALSRTSMVLGREEGCDIVLDDANISRRHAQLSQDVVGTWKLADLGSTNGTQLNGKTITNALLRDGDQITLGMVVLEYREN